MKVSIGQKILITEPHQIQVSKETDNQITKDLFLELEVSTNEAYVGQQIKLTYTFYTRVASKVLSTEFPEYNDFWVEKLFDPCLLYTSPSPRD